MNRRGFRYSPCEASRLLSSLAYRGTEYAPFTPRINFEDMNAQVHITRSGTSLSTAKGWRMARANVGVREGAWYYEATITRGITAGTSTTPEDGAGGHVRLGWARREAPLDAPVGFDAYSYGLRDTAGQKIHMARPADFAGMSFVTGDVIGLAICLPPLAAQRTISADPVVRAADVVRDRLPIRFKNQLWFEHFEYLPTREFEDLGSPSSTTKDPSTTTTTSTTNSSSTSTSSSSPATLPGSWIKVFHNGRALGAAWTDLFAFLPPASRPSAALGGRELDDGSLGYYPAVSAFKGGAVDLNFGERPWACTPNPADLELAPGGTVRGLVERYDEAIAEDVLYDLVDEVDLCFQEDSRQGAGASAARGAHGQQGIKEEIMEMVMEDE